MRRPSPQSDCSRLVSALPPSTSVSRRRSGALPATTSRRMKSFRSPCTETSDSRASQAASMPPLPAAARRASSSLVGVPLHPRASAICRVCCGEIRSACAPISRTPRLLFAVANRSVALCRPIRITRDASGPRSAIKRKKASPSGSVAIASASSITSVSSACGIARSTVSAVAQARCG